MRKPEESLKDFTVKAMAIEKAAEPAPAVLLRFTGQVEVLKPLASREGLANPDPPTGNTFLRSAPYRFSWFQGFLGAAGALAMMTLVLLSAVFIGIYDPPAGPAVASVDPPGNPGEAAKDPQPEEEPLNPEILKVQTSPLADDEARPVHSTVKQGPAGRVQPAAYRPRRHSLRPQHVVTRFIPTTLVIYAENGEIKTRIEPRLAAVYKNPLTITN